MEPLKCEICGGKLIAKAGGIFECDSCGMQYDKSKIQEMIQEIRGTVQVEGIVEVKGAVKVEGAISAENLYKRGLILLEERKDEAAKECFEKALEIDAEYASAYLGLLMVEAGIRTINDAEIILSHAKYNKEDDLYSMPFYVKLENIQSVKKFNKGELDGFFAIIEKRRNNNLEAFDNNGKKLIESIKLLKTRLARYASIDSRGFLKKKDEYNTHEINIDWSKKAKKICIGYNNTMGYERIFRLEYDIVLYYDGTIGWVGDGAAYRRSFEGILSTNDIIKDIGIYSDYSFLSDHDTYYVDGNGRVKCFFGITQKKGEFSNWDNIERIHVGYEGALIAYSHDNRCYVYCEKNNEKFKKIQKVLSSQNDIVECTLTKDHICLFVDSKGVFRATDGESTVIIKNAIALVDGGYISNKGILNLIFYIEDINDDYGWCGGLIDRNDEYEVYADGTFIPKGFCEVVDKGICIPLEPHRYVGGPLIKIDGTIDHEDYDWKLFNNIFALPEEIAEEEKLILKEISEKRAKIKEIEENYSLQIEKIDEAIKAERRNREALEEELKHLNLFQKKRKNELEAIIEKTTKNINDLMAKEKDLNNERDIKIKEVN